MEHCSILLPVQSVLEGQGEEWCGVVNHRDTGKTLIDHPVMEDDEG